MSPRHTESFEDRGITNDYMDNGWNLKQRRLMLIVGAAVGMIVGLKGCTRTEADQGEQAPVQSMSEHSVPVQAESATPLLPGLPGLREHPIR